MRKLDSNWEFKSNKDTLWRLATVPGNIFTDLIDQKIIEDPLVKNNETKVQWVSDSTWVYKTSFKMDQKTLSKECIELIFKGLDTYSKVYLNDSLLITTNNAFREFLIDIKAIAKTENVLRVFFESTSTKEKKEEEKLEYEMPEGHRIFTRKAQFQYGWDWAPKLNSSGIWKEVHLCSWDAMRFDDIFIKQQHVSKESALLEAQIAIKSNHKTVAEIRTKVNGKIKKKKVSIKKGTHLYKIPIRIVNPSLWWPNNIGKPHLYTISFELNSKGTIVDKKSMRHGIRTIQLITEKDSVGESFYFKVNGLPVYAKGANYVPQHIFQNQVTDLHYKKLLGDAVAANMNMLRVWGGGIYENDIFYELCDEMGILVWQDFMFSCAMYPGDDPFISNVKIEAEQQVKRLRNFACIALWTGNNESSEGWHRWGWQNGKTALQKKELWSNYLTIFDTILPDIVKRFSETSYWESSPKFGRGNPKYKKEGDAHDWWVWHDGYPFEHFEKNTPRFMSEFGFQSFPSIRTINSINQQDSLKIHTRAVKSHQKHTRGFQLIQESMDREYPRPKSDEEYVYLSQLLQARAITKGIEAQRRAKPVSMGSLFWQLNDCWPSISWSSIDYFGQWKALHYKAKKSFRNLLISYEEDASFLSTYVVNDTFDEIKGTLKTRIIDFYGNVIESSAREICVQSNSSKKIAAISNTHIDRANVAYISEFNGIESIYFFSKPKQIKLPIGTIDVTIKKNKTGFSVTLVSAVLQKDVFLFAKEKGHFSDNFFELLPNQPTTVTYHTDSDSLNSLEVKSLNTVGKHQ